MLTGCCLHIWTEQSYPMRAVNGAVSPIIADRPVVGQPPLLVNVSKAVFAVARGAITQRGMTTARNPAKCSIKTQPSIKGSLTASKVLKKIANKIAPMVSNVACQRWKE